MTFVETSAIVAILLEEPEAPELLRRIRVSEDRATSVINAFEASLSAGKNFGDYPAGARLVTDLLNGLGVVIEGISPAILGQVVQAYIRYGKGTGHPARLNFGDCFAYALAKESGRALVYKGEDFAKTDLGRN